MAYLRKTLESADRGVEPMSATMKSAEKLESKKTS